MQDDLAVQRDGIVNEVELARSDRFKQLPEERMDCSRSAHRENGLAACSGHAAISEIGLRLTGTFDVRIVVRDGDRGEVGLVWIASVIFCGRQRCRVERMLQVSLESVDVHEIDCAEEAEGEDGKAQRKRNGDRSAIVEREATVALASSGAVSIEETCKFDHLQNMSAKD